MLNWRTLDEKIGELTELTTTARENLVAAINEAATKGMASIYMRVTEGYIEYSGDGVTWEKLIAVAELKGEKGDKGDPGSDATVDIVTPTAESTDTQAASAKAVWNMLGGGGSGTDISLGVTGASVGDIIKVKAVDDSGKPTEWEAVTAKLPNPNALTFTGAVTGSYDGSEPLSVEIPSGGGGSGASESWKLIRTINIVSGTSSYSFDTDNNGNAFKIKNFLILIDAYPSGGYLEIKPNDNFSYKQKPTAKQNYPFSFMMKRLTDARYILETSLTHQSIFERKISGEYSSFGEFTSFSFWFSAAPAADTTMYILGEDV